jgi:hypothetical protein
MHGKKRAHDVLTGKPESDLNPVIYVDTMRVSLQVLICFGVK